MKYVYVSFKEQYHKDTLEVENVYIVILNSEDDRQVAIKILCQRAEEDMEEDPS